MRALQHIKHSESKNYANDNIQASTRLIRLELLREFIFASSPHDYIGAIKS